MQLDTGCALSLAPKSFFDQHCPSVPVKPTTIVLSTYTGEKLHPLGQANVSVEYLGSRYSLPLVIVSEGSSALMGRNWLTQIKLDWTNLPGLNNIQTYPTSTTSHMKSSLESVLDNYKDLFKPELGCFTGEPTILNDCREAKFHRARPVPFALQAKVESALRKMEKDGVIERITSATSAAPIVIVGKKESDEVRVCGDFSVTYNASAEVETHPMPQIEDMHSALRSCSVFSILDMKQAYHQIPLAKESQKYLTINTHIGLFAFKRLPNGIHSGPAIFQRIMDNLLSDIPKAVCRIDDILIAGIDHEDHLHTLSLVLDRLLAAGFRLNKDKCKFLQSSVVYLGHVIDGEGLHPTEDKLTAIRDAPRPKDVTALKSFLGLIMFYSRFMPHHSTILAPLNNLLKKNVQWKWTKIEEDAFIAGKKLLLDSQTLVHYDDSLPLILSCDASSYGAGAVLSHKIDGELRPVAFASCSLTPAQQNYSQLEKEAFSIIFGLKRFNQYLYGRSFTIFTDHKPLITLFGPHRPVPPQAAARIQRWSLILANYDYKLEYRHTTAHVDADSMSRLPLPQTWSPKSENVACYFLESDIVTNVTDQMIKKHTQTDLVLCQVYKYTVEGWPKVVDSSLLPFKNRKEELSVEQGCILWGNRVIIPEYLQENVLKELHETHPGITRMKALARSYVWWPNMDSSIESMVAGCSVCQCMRSTPSTAQLHPWTFPSRPWSRIHVDFAGPIYGRTYLVVVDAYSKYPEVIQMRSTTSSATITELREIFSRHGLPEILVSDNGPQFTSSEFQQFCRNNGITHRTCAPYKPSTNGQAERVVQILKAAIKQADITKQDVKAVIARYFLVYRNTPHSTTGESPAVMLMGRKLRTRLDLLRPSTLKHVEKRQLTTVNRTAHRNLRQFHFGEKVWARNYGGKEKWKHGVIKEVLGSRHYIVQLSDTGVKWKRHIDQLLECHTNYDEHLASTPSEPAQVPDILPTDGLNEQVEIPSWSSHDTFDSTVQIQESPMSLENSHSATENIPEDMQPDVSISLPTDYSSESDITFTDRRYPLRLNRNPPIYLKDYS